MTKKKGELANIRSLYLSFVVVCLLARRIPLGRRAKTVGRKGEEGRRRVLPFSPFSSSFSFFLPHGKMKEGGREGEDDRLQEEKIEIRHRSKKAFNQFTHTFRLKRPLCHLLCTLFCI